MKFEDIIRIISEDFTKAWNDWDIDKLMTHLATHVEIHSPKIKVVYPENTDCTLIGKEAVLEYWTRLKKISGDYRVEQISLKKEDREVKTVNKVIGKGITIYETFIVNEYGKIEYLKYEYESN